MSVYRYFGRDYFTLSANYAVIIINDLTIESGSQQYVKAIFFYKILFDVGFVDEPHDILSIILNKSTSLPHLDFLCLLRQRYFLVITYELFDNQISLVNRMFRRTSRLLIDGIPNRPNRARIMTCIVQTSYHLYHDRYCKCTLVIVKGHN